MQFDSIGHRSVGYYWCCETRMIIAYHNYMHTTSRNSEYIDISACSLYIFYPRLAGIDASAVYYYMYTKLQIIHLLKATCKK